MDEWSPKVKGQRHGIGRFWGRRAFFPFIFSMVGAVKGLKGFFFNRLTSMPRPLFLMMPAISDAAGGRVTRRIRGKNSPSGHSSVCKQAEDSGAGRGSRLCSAVVSAFCLGGFWFFHRVCWFWFRTALELRGFSSVLLQLIYPSGGLRFLLHRRTDSSGSKLSTSDVVLCVRGGLFR